MGVIQRSLFEPQDQHDNSIEQELREFRWNGKATTVAETEVLLADGQVVSIETFVNEFWTSRQRAAHSLHEISYRACFKPQLPRFFIDRLTEPGEVVYDPFMGRGTTLLEAALLGRVPCGCDVNPLSIVLVAPRLSPPLLEEVAVQLREFDWKDSGESPDELLVFYHPDTLREICAVRRYLLDKQVKGVLDNIDRWIRMIAVNRLTGHSPGFFSVYTLPPNQAVSIGAQQKINADRQQIPPRRDVPGLILAKSRSLLADCRGETRRSLCRIASRCVLFTGSADDAPELQSSSVSLVVTSPPFLDVVDYAADNWLRCWFSGIDPGGVELTVLRRIEDWEAAMRGVFAELGRILKPRGHVAFEVGEVRGGCVKLEEHVVRCGTAAGLEPRLVLINAQKFTKTANCWGVVNNLKGTNTNRVVVFRKPNRH